MKSMKKYILDTFKFRELGENFTQKMRAAVESLKIAPSGYDTVGFTYRGYVIRVKPYRTYLFFYIIDETWRTVTILRVLQDGMNWQFILNKWLKENK